MKLDDAPEPPPRTPGYECAFADLAPLLDAADRVKLAGWLSNPDATDTWVAGQLSAATDLYINHQVVARHRRGECMKCRAAGRGWL